MAVMPPFNEADVREWQVAEGSRTVHLFRTDQPKRRSGPRAVCGRYPQRNQEWPWFGLREDETTPDRIRVMYGGLNVCHDCESRAQG